MKLHGDVMICGRTYSRGSDVPWYKVYPFFLLHMLVFGGSGFLLAYAFKHPPSTVVFFLYMHSGAAVAVYLLLYLSIFGRDEVKWMFLNAGLGVFGIYSQIGWLLSRFGRTIGDYPVYVHAIPFLYFVLYTFLLRHAVLDLLRVRDDDRRKTCVEYGYVVLSVALYGMCWYLEKHGGRLPGWLPWRQGV